MSILGDRIRERRNQLRISQTDLAELLDTDQKQISKYENGKQQPTAEVLINLSKELGTTSDWLLGLTDNIEKPLRDERDLSSDEKDLILAYRHKDYVEIMRVLSTGKQ